MPVTSVSRTMSAMFLIISEIEEVHVSRLLCYKGRTVVEFAIRKGIL